MISPRTRTHAPVNSITRHRVLIGLLAMMSAFVAHASGPQTMKLEMQAQKNYFSENCFTLERGQQLAYQVSTRHPIEFNLHHHRGDGAMVYPDKLVVKAKHSKTLIADSPGGYCFMATNLADQPDGYEVVIHYEITAP